MNKALLSTIILSLGISNLGFAADQDSSKKFSDDFTKLLMKTPVGRKALSELSSATEITNANINTYNCMILVVEQLHGKCSMTVEAKGKIWNLLASPEVAQPYSNGNTASENRPQDGVTLKVSKSGEILEISKDGKRISNKIDFSR